MDSFLSNFHNNKPTTDNSSNNNRTHEHKISTSELFASAKVLAEAAKGSQGEKLDKAKVADAAGDLLCGASQYGKIDENSAMGKYVHQAEEYLHNYSKSSSSSPSSHSSTTNSSHSTTNTNTNTNTNTSSSTTTNSGSHGGGSHAESGGYGDYMKMAEGLFKKH